MKTERVTILKEQYKDEYVKYSGQYVAIDKDGQIIGNSISYRELSRSFDGKDRPYYIFPVMGTNGERPEGITISHNRN